MDNRPNLDGKFCLITGATDGIGKETALGLAQAGARVIIAGRRVEKTNQVAREITEKTGAQVDTLIGDLSIQAEVRRMADEYSQRYDRLDVLIYNAGAMFMSRHTSQDGIEMTFAVNHLGPFLLTNLLLDLLIASAPARIVNVSSGAHFGSRLNLAEIHNPRRYSGWQAYSQSKLANVYFTYELARRLEGTGVTANVLHPGFVATNFGRSNGGNLRPLFRLFQLAAITPEQGAQTSLYLAASAEVEGVTGKYYDRCEAVPSSSVSYDNEMARRLWDASLEMTGLAEKV